ncbi:MAG: hypothetical protein P4L71_00685 [Acetobacteraceae bacterium]|nr:hypothetical protein [Acetobacteraceae bacterium]
MAPWRGVVVSAGILGTALLGTAAWFLPRVPPTCADPRTLALLHDVLQDRFNLPQTTEPVHIRTLAGGVLALRFVCEADLAGFDHASLPEGAVPHSVRYASRLLGDRQEVTATLVPVLKWDKVE